MTTETTTDNILISTVGLPRCGKSTWTKNQGCPVVNPDSIRLALHGQRYIAQAEGIVWATAQLMVKALFLAGHNTSYARRTEWRNPLWKNVYVGFDTPLEVCLQRALDTNQEDLVPVINAMHAEFDSVEEGLEGMFFPLTPPNSPEFVTADGLRRYRDLISVNTKFRDQFGPK